MKISPSLLTDPLMQVNNNFLIFVIYIIEKYLMRDVR